MDATPQVQAQAQAQVQGAGAGEPFFVAPDTLTSGNPKPTARMPHASEESIIPHGFFGTWEVLQPTLKRFVIHEPNA